ncbi:MAG: RluA family pseudouridine synthase [Flavobacteriales bacterium]|nr:RluA family pseudouridine synthase [Flavobacteriales bacterium]
MFVRVIFRVTTSNTDETQALPVLWEETGLVAIRKPGGMPTQPDQRADLDALSIVQRMYPAADIGLIHRLDRPVSGVLVLALNAIALAAMNALFRERQVRKTYLAIVEGVMPVTFTLEHRLEQDARSRKARVAPNGHLARLRGRRLAQGDHYALLEIEPDTGLFHQIRAQLAAQGTPIKGDVKYGARRGERDRSIALHAHTLSFRHPVTGTPVLVGAPPPTVPVWSSLLGLAARRAEQDGQDRLPRE